MDNSLHKCELYLGNDFSPDLLTSQNGTQISLADSKRAQNYLFQYGLFLEYYFFFTDALINLWSRHALHFKNVWGSLSSTPEHLQF